MGGHEFPLLETASTIGTYFLFEKASASVTFAFVGVIAINRSSSSAFPSRSFPSNKHDLISHARLESNQ